MNVSIHIASHLKDLAYLQWCLRSIYEFAEGFSEVVIVVPEQERAKFKQNDLMGKPRLLQYHRIPDQTRWQLQAQLQKTFADQHCPKTDFILHMDSDCIFTGPVTPEHYFEDGKPIMLMEDYKYIPPTTPWKSITENVLKMPCQFETMRRHPQVNPIGIYKDLRDHVAKVQGKPYEAFILQQNGNWPPGFSEHNAIGSFALSQDKWKEAYRWYDVKKETPPPSHVQQFWSHSPIDQKQGTPCEHTEVVPLEMCKQLMEA